VRRSFAREGACPRMTRMLLLVNGRANGQQDLRHLRIHGPSP
jgi:hypothetical protein